MLAGRCGEGWSIQIIRTSGSVGSQTQLSLRCNYVLKNNYIFRPMMVIVRLPLGVLKSLL